MKKTTIALTMILTGLSITSCEVLNQSTEVAPITNASSCLPNGAMVKTPNPDTGGDMNATNCLPWKHFGTPSVGGSGLGGVWMWANQGKGEGVFQDFAFKKGKKYTITFKYTSYGESAGKYQTTSGKFYIKAINGFKDADAQYINNPAFYIPTAEGATEEIFASDFGDNIQFHEKSIIYAPQANFSKLWIYPNKSDLGPQANVSLQCLSVCEQP